MASGPLERVTTLTFDIFGTVLDLTGSLVPAIEPFLAGRADVEPAAFWDRWRARQRVEQYQDSLLMLGHSGYLETCRRALVYCLEESRVDFTEADVDGLMKSWQGLSPFEDVIEGLRRLGGRYRLVALSNGDRWLLDHLITNRIGVAFDNTISVDEAGAFKPHPSVYRTAARLLNAEPSELMMVAAHSFDVMGARACGYRGAYVDRYNLPFEDTPYRPDLVVRDFTELASRLIEGD